jgi:4-amino-4-deoxy-L-arabinose transferase-like glycosyltransferase
MIHKLLVGWLVVLVNWGGFHLSAAAFHREVLLCWLAACLLSAFRENLDTLAGNRSRESVHFYVGIQEKIVAKNEIFLPPSSPTLFVGNSKLSKACMITGWLLVFNIIDHPQR